jgi:hypothetical protein
MKRKAIVMLLVAGILRPFYTAFVVQALWNWFVAEAIHASEISYWHSFGMLLLVFVLTAKEDTEHREEKRFDRLSLMVKSLLPTEKLAALEESFKKEDTSSLSRVFAIIDHSKATLNTTVLVVGWGVHTFLM